MFVPYNATFEEAVKYYLQLTPDQQDYILNAFNHQGEDTIDEAVGYAEEIKTEAGNLIDTANRMIAQIQDIVDQIDKNTKKVDILSIIDDLNIRLGEIEQSFDNDTEYFYDETKKHIKAISELRV